MTTLEHLKKQTGKSLVLSGGATKAFYFHLGVLKVLDLHEVTSIVGSSAGAVLGSLIAAGIDIDTVIAAILKEEVYLPEIHEWKQVITSNLLFQPRYGSLLSQGVHTGLESLRLLAGLPGLLKRDILAEILDRIVESQTRVSSFFSTKILEDLLYGLLPTHDFSELKTDLYLTATDLDSGRRAVFNAKQDMIDDDNRFIPDVPIPQAVRASVAVPGLFEPIKIGGRYYIDGEIKRTLSADIGLHLADTLVVSHTYQPLTRTGNRTIKDLGWWSITKQALYIVFYERIRVWEQRYRELYPEKTIICIAPDADDEVFFRAPQFSFRKEVQESLIASGERAAIHALDKYNLTPEVL